MPSSSIQFEVFFHDIIDERTIEQYTANMMEKLKLVSTEVPLSRF